MAKRSKCKGRNKQMKQIIRHMKLSLAFLDKPRPKRKDKSATK